MESRVIKLTIAYDGAGFHGWQRQPGVRTVQEELEQTLQRVLRHPVALAAASRTDAGVHARGQTAHLRTDTRIPDANLPHALNERLPEDMTIVHARRVPDGFHATRDARSKLYQYRIHAAARGAGEFLRAGRAWQVRYALDADRLRAAASELVGTHDFSAFASAGETRQSTVRTVHRIDLRRRFDELLIDVEGDGFLYNQVRNMVGTLVEVGRGRWPAEHLRAVLASRDRQQAGPTAPPHGLCLMWVRYDADTASP